MGLLITDEELGTNILRIDTCYGGDSARCLACQVQLQIAHILLISELLSEVASRSIIDVIKETGFYR